MSNFKRKTASAYDISDYRTRLQLQKEDLFDLFVEQESDLTDGPYKGEILSISPIPDSKKFKAFIKIDAIRPVPEGNRNSGEQQSPRFTPAQQTILSTLHIEAISEKELDFNTEDGQNICNKYISQIVDVRFEVGPRNDGKTRGATFTFPEDFENTLKEDAKGSYNAICDLTSGGLSSLFEGGGWSWFGPNVLETNESNPPTNTRVTDPNRSIYTAKDIAESPFRNLKGQAMYSETAKTKGQKGYDLRGRPSNLLIRSFLDALTSNLDFKILVNSTFRTQKRQGELVTIKTFEDTKNWSGIKVYGRSRSQKFIKFYKDCKGDYKCVERKQIAYWKSIPPKGHGLGIAVDINTAGSLTAGQVKQVLEEAEKLGTSAIMEIAPPHIHIQIISAKDFAGKDPNKKEDIQPYVDKWKKVIGVE